MEKQRDEIDDKALAWHGNCNVVESATNHIEVPQFLIASKHLISHIRPG